MNIEEKLLAYETPSLQELFICVNIGSTGGTAVGDAEDKTDEQIEDGDGKVF